MVNDNLKTGLAAFIVLMILVLLTTVAVRAERPTDEDIRKAELRLQMLYDMREDFDAGFHSKHLEKLESMLAATRLSRPYYYLVKPLEILVKVASGSLHWPQRRDPFVPLISASDARLRYLRRHRNDPVQAMVTDVVSDLRKEEGLPERFVPDTSRVVRLLESKR